MQKIYTNPEQLPAVLSVEDVGSYLSISRAGAYALSHTDGFPVLVVGKRRLVPKNRFLAWLEANCEGE